MRSHRRWSVALLGVVALALASCGGDGDSAGSTPAPGSSALPAAKLALVAYSTPQEAYEKIIKAFQDTPRGKNITFTRSFGASGEQSRAVLAGLEADIVALSLEPDMTRLVKGGLVAEDWNAGQYKGMVTDSVVVLGTRKGNPKGVEDWADLTKDGIEVITPNPFTSGGARWNVMAAFGATSDQGKNEAAGVSYLSALFENVPVQDDNARKSLQTFTTGKGDVILAYENEAIFAKQKKQPLDYVVPDRTLLIENPVAVTKNLDNPVQAKAFLDFLYTETAQRIFADNGYRPVVQGVAEDGEFPTPASLFDISVFGGWSVVTPKFFDPKTGIMAAVERKLGVPTEKK